MKINSIKETGTIATKLMRTLPVLHLQQRENYLYNPFYHKLMDMPNILKAKIHSSVQHDYIREYIISQKEDDKMNLFKKKEILFCGSSNSGKSSLLNSTFQTDTFRVGRDQGTTRSLNLFEIVKNNAFVVDSPGYGYLGMKSLRGKRLHNLFRKYLLESPRVCRVFWCIELNKGPDKND